MERVKQSVGSNTPAIQLQTLGIRYQAGRAMQAYFAIVP